MDLIQWQAHLDFARKEAKPVDTESESELTDVTIVHVTMQLSSF
jgi:hypothetical protein